MVLFLYSLVILAASALVHWVWWRVAVPRFQTQALLALTVMGSIVGLVGIWLLSGETPLGQRIWVMLHFLLLQVPVSLSYIALYSMLEHDSPSLMLVAAAAGPDGMARGEAQGLMRAESLIRDRLEAAAVNGLVRFGEGRWQLESRGRMLAPLFAFLVKAFRLDRAG